MRAEMTPNYNMRLHRLSNNNLSYDIFRSEICHMYHFDGDYKFIREVMTSQLVTVLWNKKEYAKALYTLAMIDYISWKNGVDLYEGYKELRACKLEKILYPEGIVLLDKIQNSSENRERAMQICRNDPCGVFFFRHNIIEKDIEDVV